MKSPALVTGLAFAFLASTAPAQSFGPAFAADYNFVDLGSPSGIPPQLGGVEFKPGDLNTLWIGGAANGATGAIYEIAVTRDGAGHITGFTGASAQHAAAPYIDGGLTHGPTGVLFFTGYPVNTLGEFAPGSTTVNKTVDLNAAGVSSSVGSILFVPAGFAGAGSFKILSYSTSQWFNASLVPDATGTFDVAQVQLRASLTGGLEGAVYVHAGNPGFTADNILACEYSSGSVGAYDMDANGDPILASRRDFMTGLTGAEGALIDPLTGDFIFSTFGGGNRVLVVRGFTLPSAYCTAKANSLGCEPEIGYTGLPTASAADNFHVTASQVFNRKFGVLMWGLAPDSTPFHGGTRCVGTPSLILPPLHSGGTTLPATDCTGTYSQFISQAFMASHGMTPGTSVYVQYMMRDPGFVGADRLAFTAGLRFVVGN